MTTQTQARAQGDGLVIGGDVDLSTGDLDVSRDVSIHGGVSDGRAIRCAGSVDVKGSVANATIRVKGNLFIGGGAIGKDKCVCVAGEKLTVRHVNGAALQARGDLQVLTDAAQGRLITGGTLDIARGALSGGWATAAVSVICKMLGSASETPTLVEVGTDQRLRALAERCLGDLESRITQRDKLRLAAAPLVRNQKGLTAVEKERATELLYEIQEIQESIDGPLAELRRMEQQARALPQPRLVVTEVIHPGTTIRIGALETQIKCAIKGPVVLERRRVGAVHGIICIEQGTNSVCPVTTVPFRDPIMERLNRILTDQPGDPA